MTLDVGISWRPCTGETATSPHAVARPTSDGMLFGVVDALGHGEGAAVVAADALRSLLAASLRGGVAGVLAGLDAALRGGRGAAALICIVRDDAIEGCGVGNVELRSTGMRMPVVATPGVLGRGPAVRPRIFSARLVAGARLVLFSDGVSARLRPDEDRELPAQAASAALLGRWAKPTDDATVLVADVTR